MDVSLLRTVIVGSGDYYKLLSVVDATNGIWSVRVYSGTKKVTYKKGTQQLENVMSTSSSAYPNNGKSGNNWYEYIGLL